MKKDALGMHYIAEYYECDSGVINDCSRMEAVMLEAARLSGATVIKHMFHTFSPQGVSGVIIIAESHFALHTWPEHNYIAVDLFSCGTFDYEVALLYIREAVGSEQYSFSSIKRGEVFEGKVVVTEPSAQAFGLDHN